LSLLLLQLLLLCRYCCIWVRQGFSLGSLCDTKPGLKPLGVCLLSAAVTQSPLQSRPNSRHSTEAKRSGEIPVFRLCLYQFRRSI